MTKLKRFRVFMILSMVLLSIGAFSGMILGAKSISLNTVFDAIFHYEEILDHQLVLDVRLPRVLCTILVGGLLGMSGALMQGVTRNPIAEPSILGISQGAALAISMLYINTAWVTSSNILMASFAGALASGFLVILFTTRNPSNLSMSKLLLAGTACSTFFLSLSTIIGLLTNQSQMIGFLIGGGFRSADWLNVIQLVIASVFGIGIAMLLSMKINLLSLGDDAAIGLGEHPGRIRLVSLLLIIALSAVCVAVARNIGFVGLIIPQISARILSKDYRYLLPASFVAGSVLLVYSDLFARLLQSPYETPIGIFTSLIGVPFFLFLVRKEKG